MTKYDAFLSYSNKDIDDVKEIYKYLIDHNLCIWFDKASLEFGDEWIDEIDTGIKKSNTCLVFFKNDTGAWQNDEIKEAKLKSKKDSNFRIIPVLLPGGDRNKLDLPAFLEQKSWVDLRDGLMNMEVLGKLKNTITKTKQIAVYDDSITNTQFNLPIGYTASVENIITLLIGESLYSNKNICIREIIQNSIDACERRKNTFFNVMPEIIVRINLNKGYFEVEDNGDGMNENSFSNSFAIIGKSIQHEKNIMNRTIENSNDRLYLIGKFGIGFISTYIISEKIILSTTYDTCEQINLEINGISEQFKYSKESKVNRHPDKVGTTVRVYLKEVFLKGSSQIDIEKAIKYYCRHIHNLKIIKDDKELEVTQSWNADNALVKHLETSAGEFNLYICIVKDERNLIYTNGGIIINSDIENVMPKHIPKCIGGEINFFPGVIDLNIARDDIIDNEKSVKFKYHITDAIKALIIKATKNQSDDNYDNILKTLKYYLSLSLKTNKDYLNTLPFNFIEASELLISFWKLNHYGLKVHRFL
ncbi:MAG: TIR domain-containing protein [Campylobacterota bacterium]|nr:TIR domain-containing protein [Campylobacterota bacterium]